MITINPSRLLSDLRELAKIGAFETGVDRTAFSAADLEARRWLIGKLSAAGLAASMDRVGNVLGRDPAASKSILIGSHTDTVPKGGWLDGALGVVYGLEIARAAKENRAAEPQSAEAVGIDVISFQDEEGTYLSCLGSRTFCDVLPSREVEAAQAKNGEALAEALKRVSGEAPAHKLDRRRCLCYLEAHIEQGPRLEAAGQRIAVVTGLVGIRRFRIRASGRADHAGTTPMAMRHDAGAALIRFAASIADQFARLGGPDTVWNIGSIGFWPGAANVVPERAELVLEFRDLKTELLDRLEEAVNGELRRAAGGRVPFEAEPLSRIEPADMSGVLGQAIADSAAGRGERAMFLPSGAGHDAMFLARLVPSAMMFVPSIGGRSHHVSENTADSDIVAGCQVMADVVSCLQADGGLRGRLSQPESL